MIISGRQGAAGPAISWGVNTGEWDAKKRDVVRPDAGGSATRRCGPTSSWRRSSHHESTAKGGIWRSGTPFDELEAEEGYAMADTSHGSRTAR